jgi:hypothetical protein
MTNERGSVLVQVLVTMTFMAIIASSVLRMRMQPAISAANNVARVSEDLAARTALNRVNESWARLGACASDVAAGLSCSGAGCSCSCAVGSVIVTATPQGGACALSVASPYEETP